MLFILWFKFDPEHTERVREMWKQFKYPETVNLIGRYMYSSAGIFRLLSSRHPMRQHC